MKSYDSKVRKEALLGDSPEKFYTNASECINNILKLKVDRKSQSLTQFVDHAQELVLIYEKNIERAFSYRGDWRLLNSVKFDSEAKRKRALKEVKECLCNFSVFLVRSDSHPSVASLDSHSADQGNKN